MKNENYKIPLVIGITGHRDIAKIHIEELENRVKEIFDYLIKKYPNTPIVFLSPLADGADRIAAKVAFDDKYKENITVSTPLPMDEENYKKTFAKGLEYFDVTESESIVEYENLLTQVLKQNNEYIPKTIPMLFDKDAYENSTEEDKRKIRREQYSKVGEYIAIHSNILIAIYDENEEEKPGGTKEIVRKKLSGEFEYFKVLDEDVTYVEDGIVYSISTPRTKSKSENGYQIKKLFPDGDQLIGLDQKIDKTYNYFNLVKDYFFKPCIKSNDKGSFNLYTQHHKHIECFNKEVDFNSINIIERSQKEIAKLVDYTDRLIHKNLMIRRSAAYLSNNVYQPKMENIEKYILILIAITIFTVMIKSNYQHFEYASYIDFIYIVLIGLFFIFYQKFKGYKEKTEDYRAVSEALRVQTAWNMANINDATALYYLSHQKDEIGWIRTAVRGINVFYIPKDKNETFDKDVVNKYWLDEQINYFNKNIKKYNNYDNKSDKYIGIYFGIFIIFTFIFVILGFTTDINKNLTFTIFNLTSVDLLKILLVGIPLTIASYLKSKKLFDGNNDLVKEYKLSLDIFNRAKDLLNNPNKNKQEVYKNLGIEALRENSSWLITRRTKEYNTPSS